MQQGRDGRFDELHALTYLEYTYLQLGEQLLKLQRPDEATVAFRQALAMAPNTLHSVNGEKQAAAVSH